MTVTTVHNAGTRSSLINIPGHRVKSARDCLARSSGLFAMAIVWLFLAASSALAQSYIPESGRLEFKILRNGEDFGVHELAFTREGSRIQVNIEIHMSYKLGFIPIFYYHHRNTEIWEGGVFRRMDSRTDDNGKVWEVKIRPREEGGYDVYGKGFNSYKAPPGAIPTTYWNPVTLEKDALINSQKGRLEDIDVRDQGTVTRTIAGQDRVLEKYFIEAPVPITIFYDRETGQWSGLDFEVRGAELSYRRLTPFPDAEAGE